LKIKNVKITGDPNDLVFWQDYKKQAWLPDVSKSDFSNRYNVRLSHLKIEIIVNKSPMCFQFQEGYLFDHASSPKIFNWFIDHDANWVTIAAYVHDAIFHHKAFSVDFAADMFYLIMRYSIKRSKMNWFQKTRCYFRARAMKIAVKTHLADRMFLDSSDIDVYDKGKSSIWANGLKLIGG